MIRTDKEVKVRDIVMDILYAAEENGSFNKLENITKENYQEKMNACFKNGLTERMKVVDNEIADFCDTTEEKSDYKEILAKVINLIGSAVKFINPLDWDMDYRKYEISTDYYGSDKYKVFAPYEQDALDKLVDYYEIEQNTRDFAEDFNSEDEVIRAGNASKPLYNHLVSIKEIEEAVTVQ